MGQLSVKETMRHHQPSTARRQRLGLDLVDLVYVAGGKRIVDTIGMRIAPLDRLAIVGPNGAGKTSLLRLLSGRLRPSAGRVRLGERDLHSMSLSERAKHIAVVGQGEMPDLRLRLRDYVALGRIPHRQTSTPDMDQVVIDAVLAQFHLTRLAGEPMGRLSGGERQKAAIARALAQEPSILLLDEPTNHLDPRARADLLDLARRCDATVIAVLHDLALVAGFAGKVAVLQQGRLVAHGPVETALSSGTVQDVFGMDCFRAVNPKTGSRVLVLDHAIA